MNTDTIFVFLMSTVICMKKDYLYREISANMARLIREGVLQPGDKLPSVRDICAEHGVSMNTAKRVFLELERDALVEAKPQSGYYVNKSPFRKLQIPETSHPSPLNSHSRPSHLIAKVYGDMGNQGLTLFSIGAPAKELLPVAKLNKAILQATRELPGSGTGYEPLAGNERLRRAIAKRSFHWGGYLTENDIISTAGGMNAIAFCLMATTRPGDTLAVESPIYPGILQLAVSLGLKVLELPTHPQTGVHPADLEKVIHQIHCCLLVTNFNTPLGSCMPDEHKRAIVKLVTRHRIPLIEDDIYGDLYFGNNRPVCCKAYDNKGWVLWCSSASKTLAPGYRVGWVAPGRFREKVLQLKHMHAISSTAITQEAIAAFMDSGRYDQHLRQMRQTLRSNYLQYMHTIASHFPPGTQTSQPQGGLSLWVAFDKHLSTAELYEHALRQKISIAPGRMFTLQPQFNYCMRLSLGMAWTKQLEQRLQLLGKIAAGMM
jgi:DNA-binding transcriptional MocR family regulator